MVRYKLGKNFGRSPPKSKTTTTPNKPMASGEGPPRPTDPPTTNNAGQLRDLGTPPDHRESPEEPTIVMNDEDTNPIGSLESNNTHNVQPDGSLLPDVWDTICDPFLLCFI